MKQLAGWDYFYQMLLKRKAIDQDQQILSLICVFSSTFKNYLYGFSDRFLTVFSVVISRVKAGR
jgi:hypothetical protein